jgi:hypothetical protein
MGVPMSPKAPLSVRPGSLALLFVSCTFLGYLSGFPDGFGLVLVLAAVVAAAGLRAVPSRALSAYAPVPALAGIALEAASAPVGFGTELVAGLSGLAFLVWLADDPARPAGGAVRALPTLSLPALALGIAWSSALFLPAGAVPLGVAGAVLALALAAVAFLVGRPALFDREEARS